MDEELARARRRERLFRDRLNPLDYYDDLDMYTRFRFDRRGIMALTSLIEEDLQPAAIHNRPIAPHVQVK